jgi:hypothetical protein
MDVDRDMVNVVCVFDRGSDESGADDCYSHRVFIVRLIQIKRF